MTGMMQSFTTLGVLALLGCLIDGRQVAATEVTTHYLV